MRGMYTAGVIDVMMENNISFDGAIGVSAGAVFGCNLKSEQHGRVIRYNTRFSKEWRFCSFRSLLLTGDLYGVDFCYRRVPFELDVFDTDTFEKNPMDFYVTCSDLKTGKPVYHQCRKGKGEDMDWFRASASMPIVSRPVVIGEQMLLDGGISDSIPLRHLEGLGYNRNVVVLTQPYDYVKKKNKLLPLMKIVLRKYPKIIEAVAKRHILYNETLEYIKEKEKAGEIFVIRPSSPLNISSMERKPQELMRVYNEGRRVMQEEMQGLKDFLS